MKIAVSTGNSRMEKKWNLKEMELSEFRDRISQTIRTSETMEQYRKMSKAQQDDVKDVGGYVLGRLKGGRRKKDCVLSRSALTLDMDYAHADVADQIEMFQTFGCFIYSTHKHTKEKPRLRLIVPLLREVTPDEYMAVSRKVAEEIGMELFDDTTYEPSRLMYWPSTSADGEFFFKEITGDPLDPDEVLSKYKDWKDVSSWPVSNRQHSIVQKDIKKQEDPLQKRGVIGAFNRTFTITQAIDTFISDVYQPSSMPGRYDYVPADSAAGVVIYDDVFAYSHHATDPACGKLMNAFDVVRIHKFGHLDAKASEDTDSTKLPSYKAMQEFASQNEQVRITLGKEREASARMDFAEEDWKKQLEYNRQGILINNLKNLLLILNNDENLKDIVFNQLSDGMEIKGEVPWSHPSKFWRDADDAQLISYIDLTYGNFSARHYDIAVSKVTDDRSYHPIRDFFRNLPEWDGVKRVETALVDYLGAEDTPYVRAVTRKLLCAAYVRVHNPGVKFDNMIVLNGDQGIGKSTFISKLGGEWYSDSLNLSDMNDKTAAEKLQGYWIMEIGELAGMKKADLDKVKAFISRQDDKYRASFGRRVTPHPRQCVFFGTTNNENGYLRDITGNRRYWNVKVTGKGKHKAWDLDQDTVQQIWAEVKVIAKAGEKLYLPAELEEFAKDEQRAAMERDDREGLVVEYLEMLLPEGWESMDVYKRRDYVRDTGDPTRKEGVTKRTEVSNIEIWAECFGKPKEDMKNADSYAISAIMARLDGWVKTGKTKTIPIYGKQRIYARKG